jgi:predicted peptidase
MQRADEDWEADSFEGLPYRFLLPENYTGNVRYPLVVFLHGSGERGNDNRQQLAKGVGAFASKNVRARFPCIVVAPQAPSGGSFGGAWYPGDTSVQDRVARLTRELAGRRSVDPGRVYLTGLSMGAIGGWEILVRHPGLFAKAMLVCGEPKVEWAGDLTDVAVWAFHGSLDDVVPPAPARALCEELRRRGSFARWTEYADLAHVSWDRAFGAMEVYEWLFA